MNAKTHTTHRTHAGFSLMELLVVLAIIALLVGLLIGGLNVIQGGAKESQCQATLAALEGNAGQLEAQVGEAGIVNHLVISGAKYNWNTNKRRNAQGATGDGSLQDWSSDGVDLIGDENENYTYDNGDENDEYMQRANLYMMRFIWVANKLPAIRDKLPLLGAAFDDFDGNGFLEVVDPWGNPIAYASKVEHINGVDEEDDFLPEHDRPFFASAGKDQMWGQPRARGEMTKAEWDTYIQTNEYKFSIDNLYSFDPDRSYATQGQ